MPFHKRVLIVCPGNVETAGPEALHQLVNELNQLGQAAAIVYHPFNKSFSTPLPYQQYHVAVVPYADNIDELIVFPEIFTTLALKVKNAKAAIWWMSVNNYTCLRYGNPIRDKFRYFKNFIRGKRPFFGMKSLKDLIHFSQSDYAKNFLMQHEINSLSLSDPIPVYTSENYLKQLELIFYEKLKKKNVILYNPTKGVKTIEKLIEAFPQWEFKPLKGYDREALAAILIEAKLYVDFGHHPGKDRLPREAAIHRCCIITGIYGSASNATDLPFPEKYKINQKDLLFIQAFGKLVEDIFENFEAHVGSFYGYRKIISQESFAFKKQVVNAFFFKVAEN